MLTARTAGRLIWSLSGLILFLGVADVVLLISNHPVQRGMEALQPQILAIPGFATMGAVLAARRPHNPIGWLFLAVALGLAAKGFALEYAVRALATSPGSLPLGSFIAWLQQALGPVTTLPLPLLLLLFPDGRLPSRRWWPLVWTLGVSTCFVTVLLSLDSPIVVAGMRQIPNPLTTSASVPRWLGPLVFQVQFAALFASATAPLFRLRRATGDERLQLKWLAYVTGVVASVGLFAAIVVNEHPLLGDGLGVMAIAGFGIGFPVATGIAILKHGLYEIDRLINRTLVYGSLTAILGLGYFVTAAGISSLAGESSLAVAVATLAVAALFQPLRRRVQSFIDRRFYRRKYDATKTLEAFNARLRDEIDLETLTGELLSVVRETVQPVHASLWLRGSGTQR